MTGCHTQALVIRGAQTSHMTAHLASIQQQRATAGSLRHGRMSAQPRLLDGLGAATTTRGSGCYRVASAPIVVNQTKLAIIAVMRQLDSPVSSIELQKIWAEHKALEIFEYHLSTLARARVVEMVFGHPELHFRLTRGA